MSTIPIGRATRANRVRMKRFHIPEDIADRTIAPGSHAAGSRADRLNRAIVQGASKAKNTRLLASHNANTPAITFPPK